MRTQVSKPSRTNNATPDLRTAQEAAISVDRTIAISSLRTTTTDMVAAMMVVTTIVHNPAIKTTARHHHADVDRKSVV